MAAPECGGPYERRDDLLAAFGLWLRGKTPEKVGISGGMGDIRENAGLFDYPRWVWRSEIPKLFTEEFRILLMVWWRFHSGLGLPFSGGWAEQPATIVMFIDLFEGMYGAYQQEMQWQSRKS